jgi:hypothetical protein
MLVRRLLTSIVWIFEGKRGKPRKTSAKMQLLGKDRYRRPKYKIILLLGLSL